MSRTTLVIILLLLLICGGIFYLSSVDTEVPQTRMELDVTNEALAN